MARAQIKDEKTYRKPCDQGENKAELVESLRDH